MNVLLPGTPIPPPEEDVLLQPSKSSNSIRSEAKHQSPSNSSSSISIRGPSRLKSSISLHSPLPSVPRPPTAKSASSQSRSSLSRSSISSQSTRSSLDSIDSRLSVAKIIAAPETDNSEWRNILSLDEFVVKNKKFLCVLCGNILYYPIQLSHCDHNVCSSCVTRLDTETGKCPADGKKIERNKVKINQELEKKLNSQKISCPLTDIGCCWEGLYSEYKVHFNECEYKQEKCPNGCDQIVIKKKMKNHTDRECQKRHVMCKFCVRAVKAEVEIEHLKICPRFPVACPKNCGEKDVPREEVEDHVQNVCIFKEAKCPFVNLGCTFGGKQDSVAQHLAEKTDFHVRLMCEKISKNVDLLDKHTQLIQRHDETLNQNTKKLTVLNRVYGNQMLWKIDGWEKRRSEAINGKKTVLRSPHFYTGKYEYKIALSLMPNGDGTAKSRYMSLYISVCKGEYDALLKWPFQMTISLALVDQSQNPSARKDHVYVLKPNPCHENSPFLGRPRNGPNLSFGAQNFILCETLQTRDFIRDDVIFIRVRVEEDDT